MICYLQISLQWWKKNVHPGFAAGYSPSQHPRHESIYPDWLRLRALNLLEIDKDCKIMTYKVIFKTASQVFLETKRYTAANCIYGHKATHLNFAFLHYRTSCNLNIQYSNKKRKKTFSKPGSASPTPEASFEIHEQFSMTILTYYSWTFWLAQHYIHRQRGSSSIAFTCVRFGVFQT